MTNVFWKRRNIKHYSDDDDAIYVAILIVCCCAASHGDLLASAAELASKSLGNILCLLCSKNALNTKLANATEVLRTVLEFACSFAARLSHRSVILHMPVTKDFCERHPSKRLVVFPRGIIIFVRFRHGIVLTLE